MKKVIDAAEVLSKYRKLVISDYARAISNMKGKIFSPHNQNFLIDDDDLDEDTFSIDDPKQDTIGSTLKKVYELLNKDTREKDNEFTLKRISKPLISAEAIEDIQRNFSEKLSVILDSLFNTHVMSEAMEVVKSNPYILGDLILKSAITTPMEACHQDVVDVSRIYNLRMEELIIIKKIEDDIMDINSMSNGPSDNRSVVKTFAALVSAKMREVRTISKTGVSKRYVSFSGQKVLITEYNETLLKFERLARVGGVVIFKRGRKRKYERVVSSVCSNRYTKEDLLTMVNPFLDRIAQINETSKRAAKMMKFQKK